MSRGAPHDRPSPGVAHAPSARFRPRHLTAAGALGRRRSAPPPPSRRPRHRQRPPRSDRLEVYVGEVEPRQARRHRRARRRPPRARGPGGAAAGEKAGARRGDPHRRPGRGSCAARVSTLRPKLIDGQTVAARATAAAAEGFEVFRKYSGAGGLKAEYRAGGAREPADHQAGQARQDRARARTSSRSRSPRTPASQATASKPAVLYLGAQHAREWITPEMIRRLMHYVVDGYDTNRRSAAAGHDRAVVRAGRQPRRLRLHVRARPAAVAQEPAGQQRRRPDRPRRRRRPQPQLPDQVGLRQRGLLARPGQRDLPRPGPGVRAGDAGARRFAGRVGFEFLVNYHSAAELLLYGTGWQVATPTPDDVIYEAMAGDDAEPAVPGYDPDISAELYTTNGDTDTHLTERYDTLGFTPEMSTCEAASEAEPGRRVGGGRLRQRLRVPRRRGARPGGVREEHPVRAVGGGVRRRPGRPGVVGRPRRGGLPRRHASTSPTATRRRSRSSPSARCRACAWATGSTAAGCGRPGARSGAAASATATRTTTTTPSSAAWSAAPTRATTSRSWFVAKPARRARGRVEQRAVHLHGRRATPAHDVLVIANEDYTGVNPTYPAGTDAPKYAEAHVAAIEAAGYQPTSGTSTRQGVPHDLGVLGHYDAVALVPRGQPAHPGPRGRAHLRRRSGSCPTSRSPSASSTSRWRCATTSTRAAS